MGKQAAVFWRRGSIALHRGLRRWWRTSDPNLDPHPRRVVEVYVKISAGAEAPEISLDDRWNFEKFYVEIHELTDSPADTALARSGAGKLSEGHALINVAYLTESAGADEGDPWLAKLAEMVSYASAHGWLSPEGDQVTAHIVRT